MAKSDGRATFNANTVVAHNRPDDHRLIGDRHRDRHMDGSLTPNRPGFGLRSVAAISWTGSLSIKPTEAERAETGKSARPSATSSELIRANIAATDRAASCWRLDAVDLSLSVVFRERHDAPDGGILRHG